MYEKNYHSILVGLSSINFLLFNFALPSLQPNLVAVLNSITFSHPKAPLYPRLALGKSLNEVYWWNPIGWKSPILWVFLGVEFIFMQMTVTWTSGYNIDEAYPFVDLGLLDSSLKKSPAGGLNVDSRKKLQNLSKKKRDDSSFFYSFVFQWDVMRLFCRPGLRCI